MTGEARREAGDRETSHERDGQEGERPEGEPWRAVRAGGEQRRHSWLPGPQVNVAIIMSIKTNKFKMYKERGKKQTSLKH